MRRLPGDYSDDENVKRMIRVNHAGEYGATRIYAGQLAVMKKGTKARALIEHMAQQEAQHLATFDRMMKDRQVRPTLLQPLWHVGGFALGAVTALMGQKAAFACTVAVESVIDTHYAAQQKSLGSNEAELAETIAVFRAQEMEHHATALEQEAEKAPLYTLVSKTVQMSSKLAIWLSTRI